MQQKAGPQISQKAFIQSLLILFVLMMAAGILTCIVPAGSYTRAEQDGRQVIVPDSFTLTERPNYPVWRWLTAPVEVLGSDNGLVVIIIIVFLLLVGVAFAVMDHNGLLRAAVARLVRRFGARKYVLLLVIAFVFMALGAFFGIVEEIVPLVPLIVALCVYLGWDSLVGLGVTFMATNLGFAAAVTNPFTIGVAQKLAGLPLFSGAWLRIIIFVVVYGLFAVFITWYARRIERRPEASSVYAEDAANRQGQASTGLDAASSETPAFGKAMAWLAVSIGLIFVVLVTAPFIPAISDYSLPIVGLLFFIGGMGAGLIASPNRQGVLKAMGSGATGIAPAIPLILMAASVRHIVTQGGIMDTILHSAAAGFSQASPFSAALLVLVLGVGMDFFIGSGSAKAFLLMPILLPLADLVGVTRQATVMAYCFGEGFTNVIYPTNPVLLISLGLTVVSFPKWIRWLAGFWAVLAAVIIACLAVAVAIHFGPF